MTPEARRIPKKPGTSAGGLELLVDSTAFVLLIGGIMMSLLMMLAFFPIGLFAGLLGCFLSFVQWLLFRCVAEIIRLLKRLNELPYSGSISASVPIPLYACGNCSMLLHSATYCDGCGAKIIGDAQDPESPSA